MGRLTLAPADMHERWAKLQAANTRLRFALQRMIDAGNAIIGADANDPKANDAFAMYDEARMYARDTLRETR